MVDDVEAQFLPTVVAASFEIRNPYEVKIFCMYQRCDIFGQFLCMADVFIHPVESYKFKVFISGVLEAADELVNKPFDGQALVFIGVEIKLFSVYASPVGLTEERRQ